MTHHHWIAIDLETVAAPDALALFGGEVKLDKRLKDADKIREATEKAIGKAALDPWTNRIVCVGYQTDEMAAPTATIIRSDQHCIEVLGDLDLRLSGATVDTLRRTVVGYRVRAFDWPVLVHHARRLAVEHWPTLDTRPYGNRDFLDLCDLLTQDDTERVVSRSLVNACRAYGVDVPEDDERGADVATLAAAGDWDAIAHHCARDVTRTVALGRRLGLLDTRRAAQVVAETFDAFLSMAATDCVTGGQR